MFSIGNNNKITITQHDTGCFIFSTDNYTLTDGDEVHFIVKTSYESNEPIIDICVTEFNENNEAIIFISENESNISPDTYVYGICVHTRTGFICTVVNGKYKVMEGVHNG